MNIEEKSFFGFLGSGGHLLVAIGAFLLGLLAGSLFRPQVLSLVESQSGLEFASKPNEPVVGREEVLLAGSPGSVQDSSALLQGGSPLGGRRNAISPNPQQFVGGDDVDSIMVSIPSRSWDEIRGTAELEPDGNGPEVHGIPHGEWTLNIGDNGTARGLFILGQRFGTWRYYDANGREYRFGHVLNGKAVGTWAYRGVDEEEWSYAVAPE